MKVSAFTYVRNGLHFDYPFIESIKSILPIVDEFIVVIGDSFDGTKEAVEALNNPKIKIIDTVWEDSLRSGGKIFALQANTGLDNVSKDADWVFHIQADEVIHEKDIAAITSSMKKYLNDKSVEGFLFRFINFFGDYQHYGPSRRYHQHEIRIVRNHPNIRSYRDSQGFRRFDNPENMWGEAGHKLHVKLIDATIYHYSYVKNPTKQLLKIVEFGNRWNENDEWAKEYIEKHKEGFDYGEIDYLAEFKGTHPAVMKERIAQQDWNYKYDATKNNMSFKEKFMKLLQDITGKQFFIYKNYKLLK
jgi:glycosyltransferase involved in cell wall biosynthesis